MKKKTGIKITCLLLLFSIGCVGLVPLKTAKGQIEYPFSYTQQTTLNPYNFTSWSIPPKFPFVEFEFMSDVFVNLSIGLKGSSFLSSRQIYIKINNTEPIQLNISAEFDYESFLEDLPDDFNLTDVIEAYKYNCFYHIYTNTTVSNLSIYFRNSDELGFDLSKNYSLGIYKQVLGEWKEDGITLTEFKEDGTSYLRASIENVEGEKDYYITPYTSSEPQQAPSPPNWDWLIILIPGIIVVAVLALVIAKKDYIKLLKRRIVSIDKGAHRLTMEEVLENKNRSKIIDIILENPGIHFNELKRKTGLASGNLVWHLDILETYKVIKKKRVKNYVIYIPYFSKNPLSNLDLKLQKSELTLEVLEMIEENPGIWNAKITNKLETHRKTIQYHIDKLIDLGLVHKERDGIKKKIYPNLEAEYFKDNIGEQEDIEKEDLEEESKESE